MCKHAGHMPDNCGDIVNTVHVAKSIMSIEASLVIIVCYIMASMIITMLKKKSHN